MAGFGGMVLTNKGRALQAKAQTGTPLEFTKVAVGSGELTVGQTLESLTNLIDLKHNLGIQDNSVVGDGTARIRVIVSNEALESGFFVREIGIYADDPTDGEILYAVANAGASTDYLPAGGGAVVIEQVLDLITVIGNAQNVTAVISDSITLATKKDIEEHDHSGGVKGVKIKAIDLNVASTFSGALHQANPVTIVSTSGVLSLTDASNSFIANGSETITSITGWSAGVAVIRWNTSRTITHNAVSLILQGGVNRVTAVGDIGLYELTSAGARELTYFPSSVPVAYLPLTGGTLTGALVEAVGTPIASTATLNLTTVTGNSVHVTGTTPITAVTLATGKRIEVIFDGSLTLTHHATNNDLPGEANIITKAGDRATYLSDGTKVMCIHYQRYNGEAVTPSGLFGFLNKVITVTSNTAITVTADYGLLTGDFGSTDVWGVNLTLSTVGTGANKLDRGTVGNSKWYEVLIIAKKDGTVAGLLVEEANTASPILPTGYVYSYHAGWVRTHTDGTLLRTFQVGDEGSYVITTGSNTTAMPTMASGSASNSAVSTSSFVPPSRKSIKVSLYNYAAGGGAASVATNNAYGGFSAANQPPLGSVSNTSYGSGSTIPGELLLESTNVYYSSSSASAALYCSGWRDKI